MHWKVIFYCSLVFGMTAVLCGMSAGKGDVGMGFDINAYQWKNRVVIVFAESEKTPSFITQMQILGKEKAEVLDRDLVVVEILEKGTSRCGEMQIEEQAAEKLRKQFQVARGLFQVILIGKDGGAKLRREEPVSAEDLFGIIDAMPMRQQEMRRDK